jgi:four helix bundle protein
LRLSKKEQKSWHYGLLNFFSHSPKLKKPRIIGKQLLRSSTSVAANYRAACRSRSDAEFFSKISIVIEEADETLFWLELLQGAGIVGHEKLKLLLEEFEEVVKIVNSIRHNKKPNR